jgi:hypothetical protein
MRLAVALVAIGLCAARAASAQASPEAAAALSLPEWAAGPMHGPSLAAFEIVYRLNPHYQQGDFDGDGRLDIAVLIRRRTTHQEGVVIVHRRDLSVHVLGAGRALGNGGDDFAWLDEWSVRPGADVHDVRARGRDALYVGKSESGGGLIWWSGREYGWTQWGD